MKLKTNKKSNQGNYNIARSQKIFWRNQARAGRERKGVWGKGISVPPERKILEFGVGIFSEKSSDFVQYMEHRAFYIF